jgi:uncharacterized protein YhfF
MSDVPRPPWAKLPAWTTLNSFEMRFHVAVGSKLATCSLVFYDQAEQVEPFAGSLSKLGGRLMTGTLCLIAALQLQVVVFATSTTSVNSI